MLRLQPKHLPNVLFAARADGGDGFHRHRLRAVRQRNAPLQFGGNIPLLLLPGGNGA